VEEERNLSREIPRVPLGKRTITKRRGHHWVPRKEGKKLRVGTYWRLPRVPKEGRQKGV